MTARKVVEVVGDVTRLKHQSVENIKGLTICEGENIAIVGANGSGKSMLVGILTGEHPLVGEGVKYDFDNERMVYENVKYIAFRDSYGVEDSDYYYQQRWNSNDVIGRTKVKDQLPELETSPLKEALFSLFGIEKMLDKEVLLLSSGEMRKFQLTKTLLSNPRLLIIDNPFIGLDAATRDQLQALLAKLHEMAMIQVVVVLSRADEIPSYITHVIAVENHRCNGKFEVADFVSSLKKIDMSQQIARSVQLVNSIEPKPLSVDFNTAVELKDVTIRYGERTILSNINLKIEKGEKWALSGRNGSGKSTLLSLLCGDNPQAYACNITLFGRKRGSGESIWDIKRHIGYSSPELQRSYLKSIPAINIVASGLFDTLGVHQDIDASHVDICRFWMQIFGIEQLENSNFMKLSSGEQRMVLLARAFVKNPQLLILDEPFHGLDTNNRELVKAVIDAFMQKEGKTAIFVTHYIEELPSVVTHRISL